MKKLREFIDEMKEEQNGEFYISITTDNDTINELMLITESRWVPTGKKDYMMRIDTENGMKHIHITHKKHTSNKNKQVTWKEDGNRKDNKTFDKNFPGMETAKRIARDVLGVSDDILFESASGLTTRLILENVEPEIDQVEFFAFKI